MTSKARWAMAAATAPLVRSERGFERPIYRRFTHLGECPVSAHLPVASRPREGPLTEPIAGVQPRPQERVLMPHTRRSQYPP